jgi:hypothetical protein
VQQPANGTGKLYRIDPTTERVTTVDLGNPAIGSSLGNGGRNLGFGIGSVWTCDPGGTVSEVDPATTTIKSVRRLPFDTCKTMRRATTVTLPCCSTT